MKCKMLIAYCVSPKSLASRSLPPDESPAFFSVSPTITILDFSALPWKIEFKKTNKPIKTEKQNQPDQKIWTFVERREIKDGNTPFLREWTKILPSTESANRIPSGLSRVTMYSFKFILNDGELLDIARILTVPPLERSFSGRLIVERPLMKDTRPPQKEEEEQPWSNGGDEGSRAPVLGSCRVTMFLRNSRQFFSVAKCEMELQIMCWNLQLNSTSFPALSLCLAFPDICSATSDEYKKVCTTHGPYRRWRWFV